MSTNSGTVTWFDDTLEGLMDFHEHAAEVSPGFGLVSRLGGQWCWMMVIGPPWFRRRMHPQRNPHGLRFAEVFDNAIREQGLRGLTALDDGSTVTPLGWLFAFTGWSLKGWAGEPGVRPAEHPNGRRVYTSSFLDHNTGDLITHANFYPDELQVVTETMPAQGWQAGERRSIVATMDLFRQAALDLYPAEEDPR